MAKTVLIRIISEDDELRFVRMSKEDANKCEALLNDGEWHDEVNTILNKAKIATPKPYATISTMGDGHGFYR